MPDLSSPNPAFTAKDPLATSLDLAKASRIEGEKFQEYYHWLEKAMPQVFFEEVGEESLTLITHSLMGFDLQDYFCTINRKNAAIGICLDTPDADLRILAPFSTYGIKNYQAYVSKEPAPFVGVAALLRIATLDFTEATEETDKCYPLESKKLLFARIKQEESLLSEEEMEKLLAKLSPRFLLSLPIERLSLALHLFHRAQTRDSCQYEVRYEEQWQEKATASMHMVLAWRNTPKHNFLYKLAKVVHRHGLSVKRVNAIYCDKKENTLIMALSLHGSNGQAVWAVADTADLVREITTLKYFEASDNIDHFLVSTRIISGNMGNLLRAMVTFIHQGLTHADPNLYTIENIEEAFCRHPELTIQLLEAFKMRFDPVHRDADRFEKIRTHFLNDLSLVDTGQESNDERRKNVLLQGMYFITHTLKTNFYRLNYTSLSFRLDPIYLETLPFDRTKKFPELPYAIFFIKGMNFFGFHIRFKDLARGGLRTILPEQKEQMMAERNLVFSECYHLAFTQHKKNKDIPEGGAKAVIFLQPFALIDFESPIFKKELERLTLDLETIEKKVEHFQQEQKLEYLYQSQRAFIESLVSIVNCDEKGVIRARFIVDYWKKPEYLYLGPDENMHDAMIEWIAAFAKKYDYKPGGAFITSKPKTGINHKEYGVTSLGVNVYMHKVLQYLGIDPDREVFRVKMTGGPDGDVAGNQLCNLHRLYPKTAKVVALTDGTGTIKDEAGLDLETVVSLFHQGKGIAFYPPEKLSTGGLLVNKKITRKPSNYIQETLCYKNQGGSIIEEWLSGSATNHYLNSNVHQTEADIFIPAGGRPRTLNENNVKDFFNLEGKPTAKAIVEGANLYLTPKARKILEENAVLIIKDSSANKGGVICSSFEVLCGLCLKDEVFLEQKKPLVFEILERIKECAFLEAHMLLHTHKQTKEPLTLLSDKISERINLYTYQLLDYLDRLSDEELPLAALEEGSFLNQALVRCFLDYALPTLKNHFSNALLKEIPKHHKKAIIARSIASYVVYHKGLEWSPTLVDILPLIVRP